MRRLGKIVSHLSAMRHMNNITASDDGRLETVTGFGSNPGQLDCRIFLPSQPPRALVVVLHGCTQDASGYDHGSGWSKLAERHGFAAIYPQQRRANNANLCFNWYSSRDARRGRGEAESIAQMVRHVVRMHDLDRARTFVNGLSAGGAMTAVMLACYPELFAGGAIIAGLPFATADTLPEALERMRGEGFPPRELLASRARGAAPADGPPPTLSVWHGTNDRIVDRANATAIVKQWLDWHKLAEAEGLVERIAGHRREVWSDRDGQPLVEKYNISGMGHGTPLATGDSEACGNVGPHMLEASICSTRLIAGSWGLTDRTVDRGRPPARSGVRVEAAERKPQGSTTPPTSSVGAVIENALRSAGLMR